MADLIWLKGLQFPDSNGDPLASGTINTYDAGTLSARTVYQDADEQTAWTQPITLDSAGKLTASVYVPSGDWKFILKNSAGSTITTEDNIPGAAAAEEDFASPETPIVTKAGNYTVTVNDLGRLFVVDSSSGSVTLALPAAGLVASGRGISVIHNGSANSVILDPDGAETINGASTLTLTGKPSFTEIISDGSSVWYAKSPLSGGQLTGALDWKAAIDLVSAASLDFGAETGNLLNITGSTGPIAALGTAPSGEWRWVKFASTPTITHNGTSLILPGAANIAAAAGDTALFISEGSGNWRCYAYHKASGLANVVTAASDSAAGAIEIADQSEMEAATSATLAVTPGRQHFHPGHPKAAAKVTVSGGTPTLQTSSDYNITSIADTATGQLTITIATDFSDAHWVAALGFEFNLTPAGAFEIPSIAIDATGQAVGSLLLYFQVATESADGVFADPVAWHMIGVGDFA